MMFSVFNILKQLLATEDTDLFEKVKTALQQASMWQVEQTKIKKSNFLSQPFNISTCHPFLGLREDLKGLQIWYKLNSIQKLDFQFTTITKLQFTPLISEYQSEKVLNSVNFLYCFYGIVQQITFRQTCNSF